MSGTEHTPDDALNTGVDAMGGEEGAGGHDRRDVMGPDHSLIMTFEGWPNDGDGMIHLPDGRSFPAVLGPGLLADPSGGEEAGDASP